MFRTQLSFARVAVLVLLALSAWPAARAQSPAFANFEPAQTNPIRLSADRTRLFAVNTDNATLSVFDLTTPSAPALLAEIPVGLGPVSVSPLTDDIAWVVNQVSNSVSIISVSKQIVTATLNNLKPEPMDVVFAGINQAYISLSRSNTIVVVNPKTLATITQLSVFGGNPRALAVSPDKSTVYAAFALSGNATTLIGANLAPPQPPPTNPLLPPPPQVGLIVFATDPQWKKDIGFKMPDNDVVQIKTGAVPSITRYYSAAGTINLGLAVNPITGDLYVANTDALNTTHFVTNLRGHWVNNRITRIQTATGLVTAFDLNPGINYGTLPNPSALSTALAQPTNIAFDPSGSFMWVAAFGTDRVARVDTNGNVLGFVEVSPPSGSGSNADPPNKRGPRGLALNAPAGILYCLNRISNTISVISTAQNGSVLSEIPVGTDNTPSTVKSGRGFLYDAKLSGNGTGSCASCHIDGDMDHLAWDLGDPAGNMTSTVQSGQTILFHPMKGPMTTQSLRGLLNLSPYHWRGDKPDFAAFNSTFNDLMGGSELSTDQMNAYTSFVNTILYLPNPNQNLDRTLPTSLPGVTGNPVQGQVDFLTLALSGVNLQTCDQCHTDNGPGTNRMIDAHINQQPLKNPQLRNIYQKLLFNRYTSQTIDGFGLQSDGSASGLSGFFGDPIFALYTPTEINDMSAYVMCFDTGAAPAVGFTLTLSAANVNVSTNQSNWTLLQSQAGLANIDLIARGTIQGQLHGLLYQPSTSTYLSDNSVTYTQAQLQTYLQGTDTLSFMGVFPGTGAAAIPRNSGKK